MSGFLNAVGAFFVLTFDAVVSIGLVFFVGRFMVRRAPSLMAKAVIFVVAFYIAVSLFQHFIAAFGALL